MSTPIYDKIGSNYNSTRRADSYIAGRLYDLMVADKQGSYLDIGCGTGNYLGALSAMGLQITGIEPSTTMIEKAKANNPANVIIQGQAENIPLPDNSFDGGMGTFTVHHWTDMQKGFKEIYRVLKPGANFVLLSFTPEQLHNYWLFHYFPNTMTRSAEVVESIEYMSSMFEQCGFSNVLTENYFVHEGLTDHFLYSNKYHPEQYLNPEIRNGASSFTVYADKEEVANGLITLENDINTGKIQSVIEQYENNLGDYIFYRITKPEVS